MAGEMNAGARIDWERSTASHIQRSMENQPVEAPFMQLAVIADISNQGLVFPETPEEGIRRRVLQEAGDGPQTTTLFPLQVDFLIRITFRSVLSDYNLVDMIGEAFNSEEERTRYISRLQQLNGNFDNLEQVTIEVEGNIPEEQPVPALEDDSGVNGSTVMIIAVAAGGVAIAVIVAGLLVWNRNGSRTGQQGVATNHERIETTTAFSTDPSGKAGYTAEILVEGQDDVSTLGDPVYGMMTTSAARDEATASVGNDYDYSKQYLKAQGIASVTGGSGSRGRLASLDSHSKQSASSRHGNLVAPPSVFSDDESFEQQFSGVLSPNDIRVEVAVPPGKLGMVIDTPQGSIPLVHALKPNSVLADQVQVNDRLVSVDGEDVTHMTAVQVSKLISLKADQTRKMVFVRPRALIDTHK
jgi:hypothetical protein